MSDFLAEARIVIRPDTGAFRAELEAQLRAATAKPITIPVVAAAGPSLAGAAVATSALTSAQTALQTSTLGLATAAQVESSAFGRQAVVLESAQVATTQLAGAQLELAAAEKVAAASSRQAAAEAAAHARQLGQIQRGAASAGLTFLGLRGATLAASGAFIAGAAGVLAFSKAIKATANLETSLNVFQVTAGATADEMARVSEEARALGTDLALPGVNANQAAEALTNLSRAGLSVQDAIDGARGTLQLATAAAIDNQEAVVLVASALNAFGLAGAEAVRVADLLAAAANESQGSISDMGLSLQQSSAAAAQAGVTVEDTVSLLTLLARAGLRGSDAGTSLRVALVRLIAPTEAANDALKRLNINVRDATGNVRPEVFFELERALSGLTKAQEDATLALIFGQDAFRAAAILGAAGARGLDQTREAVEKQGVAAEVAAARTKGLAGAAENLKNQAEALGATIGDELNEPTTAFLEILAGGVKNINATAEALKGLSSQNEEAAQTWAELTEEAGRFNALAATGAHQDSFLERLRELNKQLDDSQSASLKARDAIESYRASLALTVTASDSLNSRLDESTDRFSHVGAAAAKAAADVSLFLAPSEKTNVAAIEASATEGLTDDIAAAQQEAERAAKALADFEADPNRPGKSRARFAKLVEEDARARAALAKLRQQASDQAATSAKAAAEAARQAASAAQQEFLSQQQLARAQAQNRAAEAARTPGLKDDIKRQNEFLTLVRAQIAAVKKRIKDRQAQLAAVAALRAIELQVEAAIAASTEAIAARQQEAREQATSILGQRLQLAEARGQKDQILAALNAAIKDARDRVKAAKTLTERLDEQIALQELINRKNEILNEKTDETDRLNRSFFEFLQAQKGFAANLLGNLIPQGATAGLVGNVSTAAAAPTLFSEGAAAAGVAAGIGTGVSEEASISASVGKGPTTGQMSTLISVARQIAEGIAKQNVRMANPEAKKSRAREAASQDAVGNY